MNDGTGPESRLRDDVSTTPRKIVADGTDGVERLGHDPGFLGEVLRLAELAPQPYRDRLYAIAMRKQAA